MESSLKVKEFGDPLLRQKSKLIDPRNIADPQIQNLIKEIKAMLSNKELGVGLAAPQVGKNLALAVVAIRPSKRRPKAKIFDLVIINPRIVDNIGRRQQMYEGCISGGSSRGGLFAKVPRYKKIKVEYYDEKGHLQNQTFEGLPAHVVQHEIDHLNGVLFVDRVKDTTSYKTYSEYMKHVKSELKKKK